MLARRMIGCAVAHSLEQRQGPRGYGLACVAMMPWMPKIDKTICTSATVASLHNAQTLPRGCQKGKLYRTSQDCNWCLGHGFGRWASDPSCDVACPWSKFPVGCPVWSPGETRRHRLLVVFQSAKRETLENHKVPFCGLTRH